MFKVFKLSSLMFFSDNNSLHVTNLIQLTIIYTFIENLTVLITKYYIDVKKKQI